MTAPVDPVGGGERATVYDLALGQGPAAELAALRERIARDPLAALEFAEARQFLEDVRTLRMEPGPRFQGRMAALGVRAEQHLAAHRERVPLAVRALPFVAAAAALLVSLWLLDPLRLGDGSPARDAAAFAPPPARVALQEPPSASKLRRPDALATIYEAGGRLTGMAQLPAAVQRFVNLGTEERLACWLQAGAQVAGLRDRFEQGAASAWRQQALPGDAAALDERIQQRCRALDADLRRPSQGSVAGLALAVRAQLAAGGRPGTSAALDAAAARLVELLPLQHGGELAAGLLAMAEFAAATGRYVDPLREHGERLVREVLECDGETWAVRLPALLSTATSADQIADAGRFLRLAPAFGLDGESCVLVRLLLAGHLQQRRAQQGHAPELLAALLFGAGDLLLAAERRELEERLAAWQLAGDGLAPEVLHHLLVSLAPAAPARAEAQREVARLAAAPEPEDLRQRAATCLALAASYAPGGDARPALRQNY